MTAPLNQILKFLRLQTAINTSPQCLVGKTALVTGAHSGAGYYTCLMLASRGCKVIMTDHRKLDYSRERLVKETGNENISSVNVDLANFSSIRNFAKQVSQAIPCLDILIHHASISSSLSGITLDGLNTIMQVNYLGPFLLTHLLLKPLVNAAPSRILFACSNLAFLSRMDKTALSMRNPNSAIEELKIYIDSQMAKMMAAEILSKELKELGITTNTFHTGYVNDINGEERIIPGSKLFETLGKCYGFFFGKTPWEGCQTATYLAMDKSIEKTTGMHFWENKPFFKPYNLQSKSLIQELWASSEILVKLKTDEQVSNFKKSLSRGDMEEPIAPLTIQHT